MIQQDFVLLVPEHINPVAYLCLGYVTEFPDKPDLEMAGWLCRLKLNDVIYFENWGGTFMKKIGIGRILAKH
jgi:hypothetical protein